MEISGKIKWESRRGMREIDLMLLPFVEHDLPNMDEKTLKDYEDLLEATDLELVRWFNGTCQPDSPRRQKMVATIVKCHQKRIGKEGI